MKVKLNVYKDNDLINELDLPELTIEQQASGVSYFVGRSEKCQLVLDHQSISREHFKIYFDNGKWHLQKLTDLGIVIVNGNNVEMTELQSGDFVNVGPFNINVYIDQKIQQLDETQFLGETKILGEEGKAQLEQSNEEVEAVETPREEQDDEVNIQSTLTNVGTSELLKQSENVEEDVVGDFDINVTNEMDAKSITGHNPESDFSNDSDNQSDNNFNQFDSGDINNDFEVSEMDSDLNENMDDGFGGDMATQDQTNFLGSFSQFKLRISGEYNRIDEYIIEESEVYIGRDENKCQIILDDPEVSQVHAVIKRQNITCTIEDLQSSNGTILNGKRIIKSALTNNDEILIGTTNFEFIVESGLLREEGKRLMPIETEQEVEVEEYVEEEVEVDDLDPSEFPGLEDMSSGATAGDNKSLVAKFKNDPVFRKRVIMYGSVLLLILLLFEDPEAEKPQTASNDKKKIVRLGDEKQPKANPGPQGPVETKELKLSPSDLEKVEDWYKIAKEYFDNGEYLNAEQEIDKILATTNGADFREAKQIKALAQAGYKRIEELNRKKQEEKERKERQIKIKALVEKAQKAVDEKRPEVAEAIFAQIFKLDPDNTDIATMRLTLDAWKKEEERKRKEQERKEKRRNDLLAKFQPSKTVYLKENWYKAILELEKFLREDDLDEDLIIEASNMLKTARKNLSNEISPILGKAKSLQEGQDLKGAYEVYKEVLQIDPSHLESMNQMNSIRDGLDQKSRAVYREAIISESLNLLDEAKEKFQEVKQISPTDSEYYIKADRKLKSYMF